MELLKKRRAGATSPAALTPPAGTEAEAGLDAFASESSPPRPARRAVAGGAWGSPHTLPAFLGVLVLLQAVPTYLWVQERVGRTAVASAAAPASSSGGTESGTAIAEAAALPSSVPGGAGCDADQVAGAPAIVARPETRAVATTSSPAASPGIAAGMLAVDAPVAMQVLQRGEIVGTTEAKTIMLSAGTHDLEFRNEAVGYSARRTVTVQAGRTARLRLETPPGRLSVNALPWAEVWIDNRRAGETPIGNLEAAIGRREIVFRHPELGERRTTVLVTLREPARVSMDLRQP